jgi:hypothetical protein
MKTFLCCTCGLLLAAASLQATPLFSDDFNSYTSGNNLAGSGPWLQTGSSTATPITINGSGRISINASGQDVYAPLPGGTVTLADGNSFYMGLDINVASVVTTSGDYFMHYASTATSTATIFENRLYIKPTTGGYLLGWAGSSGNVMNFGSTVLTFGSDHRVVVGYNAVTGLANDTGVIYVDPTSSTIGLNTPYLTSSWITGTEITPNNIAAVNFRQGSSGPVLTADNLIASLDFADAANVTLVPEPTILSLLGGFGLLALGVIRRRK